MNATDRIIYAQTDHGRRIGTARDHIGAVRSNVMSLRQWFERQAAARFFPFQPELHGQVYAEVNHGHWIVNCLVCTGAEEADWHEPIFYCLSCGNMENDGKLMRVIFPEERERIEALLLLRPVENRNWLPGETVEMLVVENLSHGLGHADQ